MDFYTSKSSEDEAATSEPLPGPEIESAEEMVHRYLWLKDATIESLKDFPAVAGLFVRYNTDVVSSAGVERFFSTAKSVLSMNRCCLSAESFEAQLVLKSNSM